MRHTTKMLLIPEDVYKELVASAASARRQATTTTSLKVEPSQNNEVDDDNDDDGKLLKQTRKTMKISDPIQMNVKST